MAVQSVETFPGVPSLETDRSSSRSGLTRRVLTLVWQNAATAGAYWLLAILIKEYFSSYQMWPAPIWLPSGVALFAAVAMGPWSSPGIFLGALAYRRRHFQRTARVGGLFYVRQYAGAASGRGTIPKKNDARGEPFSQVADVIYFCFAAFLDGAIAATICATAICAKAYAPLHILLDKWFGWMLSDAGAALLLTPFLLVVLWAAVVCAGNPKTAGACS